MKIKDILQQANLYQPLYDVQIAQTEQAIAELKRMQAQVKKDGLIITKVTAKGEEPIANPLLPIINQFHRTITQQLASLGLNMLKVQQDGKKNEMMAFLNE